MTMNLLNYFCSLFLFNLIAYIKGADINDCWEKEDFNITLSCHGCSSVEAAAYTQCLLTGYMEILKCEKSGVAIRSCPQDKKIEASKFWKFELSMICVSLVSGIIVMLRRKKLDRLNMDRIHKQLSAL